MIIQKNLYNVVFDAVNDGVWSAVSEGYSEQFQNNRSGFTTKYRAIDGAIYKSDDIKQILKTAEDSANGFDKLDDIQDILLNLYSVTYDICKTFDENKTDEVTVHTIPTKDNSNRITLFEEFIPEKIIPLLEYIKGVLKDSKNNISFDDCINVVTIYERALDSINTVMKPGYKKNATNEPVLGGNYLFKITVGQKEEPEVKAEEKPAEKPEEPMEPLFFEPVPDEKRDAASGSKFNFSDYDVAAPEKEEGSAEAEDIKTEEVKAEENNAEEEAPALEPEKEAGPEKPEKAFDSAAAFAKAEEEAAAAAGIWAEREAEAREKTEAAPIREVNTYRLRDCADKVAKALKEFENSREIFDNLKESIEVKINLPGDELTGSSQSIIDEIRKNINATIQNSLHPLRGKLESDYSAAVDSVNKLYDEVDNVMQYLKDVCEKLGLDD